MKLEIEARDERFNKIMKKYPAVFIEAIPKIHGYNPELLFTVALPDMDFLNKLGFLNNIDYAKAKAQNEVNYAI